MNLGFSCIDRNFKPLLLYSWDFTKLRNTAGEQLCSDRTLRMMKVYEMQFCGQNDEYIAVHYEKEKEAHQAFHWVSNSSVAIDLPDPLISDFSFPAGERDGDNYLKITIENEEDIAELESDMISGRNNGPRIVFYFRDRIVYVSRWAEKFCISSNGRYLGCVLNWEDGDQREDPDLKVIDLKSFFMPLLYYEKRSFLIFQKLLKNCRDNNSLMLTECSNIQQNAMMNVLLDNDLIVELIKSFL